MNVALSVFIVAFANAAANSHNNINADIWKKESVGKKVFLKLYGLN
jgi:hypothetical protein